jgi:hypothetical protein
MNGVHSTFFRAVGGMIGRGNTNMGKTGILTHQSEACPAFRPNLSLSLSLSLSLYIYIYIYIYIAVVKHNTKLI